MSNRQYLEKPILLCIESNNGTLKRTFTIVKRIDEGASVVCYEAFHENSGRGVLKEFYPQNAYGVGRDGNGQLTHSPEYPEARECFLAEEKQYIEPYNMLLAAKRDSAGQDLSTFIPEFEIYRGCDENGKAVGTTYIWTPEPKLETFDVICEEIHNHPEDHPEYKLVTVLNAVDSLTKCISALHSAELVHRDIKPSNFGFRKRGDETLIQTLTMFDVNSICSVYRRDLEVVGSEGFMEPEVGYEPVDNKTDIYAIGATLFYALIISDEAKAGDYRYQRKYYDRLREMVDSSLLIQASEANSHPKLRNILTGILQKCLCDRADRYERCEDLHRDLAAALYYVLPPDAAGKVRDGEKWILADMEKSLDAHQKKNSFLAIQYHLYEHPLYQCVKKEEDEINVLVLGFGGYGQKFLDACLQNGQIQDKKLKVTVVSDDKADRDIYLSERPELADFFNIDGSLEQNSDAYGDISFENRQLKYDEPASNEEMVREILSKHYDGRNLHYVFVALGNDQMNASAAKACRSAAMALDSKCIINYICEGKKAGVENKTDLFPLYVNRDIRQSGLYPEIERMAFNAHLVWEKNLNVDYKAVRAEFKKPYNHDSCVSNVLSIKYKLYSMGIDLGSANFNEAARQFMEKISDRDDPDVKELVNRLMWAEHKRWVTEKLCQGWRAIHNLEDCADGTTKDERRKRHICIVKSRPDQMLATEYRVRNYDKWENATEAELSRLDGLDRMSVELHRVYREKAKTILEQNLLPEHIIHGIRGMIEADKKASTAFWEWYACVKNIINISRGKINKTKEVRQTFYLYKGLEKALFSSLEGLPVESRQAVKEQLKAYDAFFLPVRNSIEYREWKQDDEALTDSIPFILTYTEDSCLVIPYMTGDNTALFENVAAPTVVNPEKIIYLYLAETRQDVRKLRESVPYLMEYMGKKLFRASVDFVIAYQEEAAGLVNESLEKELKDLGQGWIRLVKRIEADDMDAVPGKIEAFLKQRKKGKRLFAVEKNASSLSYLLQGAGVYRRFACYQFDSYLMKFHHLSGCDMLGCIRKMPHITVSDLAAFRLSSSETGSQPEFYDDFKDLWKKYCEGSGNWKLLCDILSEHALKNDVLASFKKKSQMQKFPEAREYTYLVPEACRKGAAKIVQFLKEQKILEQGSSVHGYSADSCEILVVDRCGCRNEYNALFASVYALMFPDDITLRLNTRTREVTVTYNNLVVSGASIAGNKLDDLNRLMGYFRWKGYVNNLNINDAGVMSFTYASKQIKELLTTAGKILEIYTYHKVRELGEFDSVVSSFVIDWEESEAKSEIDCVISKGFRTLFIECKARSDIEQEFYYKLVSLTRQFGINATAVLIADTQEKSYYDNAPVNAMQRRRGSMMDVVTIWKQEEISDIGHILKKIINGTYVSEN